MCIVIPNHLPHLAFLGHWEELKDEEIIVVQDSEHKPNIPKGFSNITIYDWNDIKDDLGKDAWIIPTRTSACRTYGFFKAWERGADVILTLDNDCYPERPDYWVKGHIEMLNSPVTHGWVKTHEQWWTRGVPYKIRNATETYINHGLWSNVPDFDAPTSLLHKDVRFEPTLTSQTIPKGSYYAHCGMNFAWKREATPLMYFGLQGPDYPYDRMDDIWAGIIFKKIADHLGWGVRSGFPSVEHRKQSNVYANLKKEAPGIEVNEDFWKKIDSIQLTSNEPIECFREVANEISGNEYWDKLSKAMNIWANLFS